MTFTNVHSRPLKLYTLLELYLEKKKKKSTKNGPKKSFFRLPFTKLFD
jgi:hypothetical protein